MNVLISTIIFFISWTVSANDSQQITVPAPAVRFYQDSSGYHIATNDGREITAYEYVKTPKEVRVDLTQIENTCEPYQEPVKCQLIMDMAPVHYLLVWNKHIDPAKVGTVVDQDKLTEGWYSDRLNTQREVRFRNDRLSCTDYAWTSEMRRSDNGSFIADAWASELMSNNKETDVTENFTDSSAFEVLLRLRANELEIESVKSDYSSRSATFAPYLSAQVSNLSFLSVKNRTCQISFQSNITEALAVVRSSYFTDIDMKKIVPVKSINHFRYRTLRDLFRNKVNSLKSELMP